MQIRSCFEFMVTISSARAFSCTALANTFPFAESKVPGGLESAEALTLSAPIPPLRLEVTGTEGLPKKGRHDGALLQNVCYRRSGMRLHPITTQISPRLPLSDIISANR
jgi:hypothetical protein